MAKKSTKSNDEALPHINEFLAQAGPVLNSIKKYVDRQGLDLRSVTLGSPDGGAAWRTTAHYNVDVSLLDAVHTLMVASVDDIWSAAAQWAAGKGGGELKDAFRHQALAFSMAIAGQVALSVNPEGHYLKPDISGRVMDAIELVESLAATDVAELEYAVKHWLPDRSKTEINMLCAHAAWIYANASDRIRHRNIGEAD